MIFRWLHCSRQDLGQTANVVFSMETSGAYEAGGNIAWSSLAESTSWDSIHAAFRS